MSKNYTVLLRYPDYYSGNWPDDQVNHRVKASSIQAAVNQARRLEVRHSKKEGNPINDPTDLSVVAVYAGHRRLLAGCNDGY